MASSYHSDSVDNEVVGSLLPTLHVENHQPSQSSLSPRHHLTSTYLAAHFGPLLPTPLPRRRFTPSDVALRSVSLHGDTLLASGPRNTGTAPVNLPARADDGDLTPLTGRPSRESYFPDSSSNQSINVIDQLIDDLVRTDLGPTRPSSPSVEFDGLPGAFGEPGESLITMNRHLLVSRPSSPHQPGHRLRRLGRNVEAPSLGRFHPAYYESPSPSGNHRSGFGRSRALRMSGDTDPLWDFLPGLQSPRLVIRPSSPTLRPTGSPGPVTPLMLEEQDDYLAGGRQDRQRVDRTGNEGDRVLEWVRDQRARLGNPEQ